MSSDNLDYNQELGNNGSSYHGDLNDNKNENFVEDHYRDLNDTTYHTNTYGNRNDRFNDSSNPMKRIVVPIMVVFGFILGGVGFYLLKRSTDKKSSWTEVVGTIIGTYSCGQSCSSSGYNNSNQCSTTYGAIIEYQVNGNTYEFQTSSCSNPPPKVGNEIAVLYDPDDPSSAVNGSWVALWLAPIILITYFCGTVIVAMVMLYKKFTHPTQNNNNNINGVVYPSSNYQENIEAHKPPMETYVNTTSSNTNDNPDSISNPYVSYSSNKYDANYSDTNASSTLDNNTANPTTSLFDQMQNKL